MAFGILVRQPGSKPRPWQWKRGVLTTGSPGNSPTSEFLPSLLPAPPALPISVNSTSTLPSCSSQKPWITLFLWALNSIHSSKYILQRLPISLKVGAHIGLVFRSHPWQLTSYPCQPTPFHPDRNGGDGAPPPYIFLGHSFIPFKSYVHLFSKASLSTLFKVHSPFSSQFNFFLSTHHLLTDNYLFPANPPHSPHPNYIVNFMKAGTFLFVHHGLLGGLEQSWHTGAFRKCLLTDWLTKAGQTVFKQACLVPNAWCYAHTSYRKSPT